jgi:hypothetical protein
LRLPIPFRPVVRVSITDEVSRKEAFVSQYFRGSVQRLSCIEREEQSIVEVGSTFYAHRIFPSVIEQDVTIRNPGYMEVVVQFDRLGWSGDPPFSSDTKT